MADQKTNKQTTMMEVSYFGGHWDPESSPNVAGLLFSKDDKVGGLSKSNKRNRKQLCAAKVNSQKPTKKHCLGSQDLRHVISNRLVHDETDKNPTDNKSDPTHCFDDTNDDFDDIMSIHADDDDELLQDDMESGEESSSISEKDTGTSTAAVQDSNSNQQLKTEIITTSVGESAANDKTFVGGRVGYPRSNSKSCFGSRRHTLSSVPSPVDRSDNVINRSHDQRQSLLGPDSHQGPPQLLPLYVRHKGVSTPRPYNTIPSRPSRNGRRHFYPRQRGHHSFSNSMHQNFEPRCNAFDVHVPEMSSFIAGNNRIPPHQNGQLHGRAVGTTLRRVHSNHTNYETYGPREGYNDQLPQHEYQIPPKKAHVAQGSHGWRRNGSVDEAQLQHQGVATEMASSFQEREKAEKEKVEEEIISRETSALTGQINFRHLKIRAAGPVSTDAAAPAIKKFADEERFVDTYAGAIEECIHARRLEDALRKALDAKQSGHKLRVSQLEALLLSCHRDQDNGTPEIAQETFDLIEEERGALKLEDFIHLIGVLCQHGKVDLATNKIEIMKVYRFESFEGIDRAAHEALCHVLEKLINSALKDPEEHSKSIFRLWQDIEDHKLLKLRVIDVLLSIPSNYCNMAEKLTATGIVVLYKKVKKYQYTLLPMAKKHLMSMLIDVQEIGLVVEEFQHSLPNEIPVDELSRVIDGISDPECLLKFIQYLPQLENNIAMQVDPGKWNSLLSKCCCGNLEHAQFAQQIYAYIEKNNIILLPEAALLLLKLVASTDLSHFIVEFLKNISSMDILTPEFCRLALDVFQRLRDSEKVVLAPFVIRVATTRYHISEEIVDEFVTCLSAKDRYLEIYKVLVELRRAGQVLSYGIYTKVWSILEEWEDNFNAAVDIYAFIRSSYPQKRTPLRELFETRPVTNYVHRSPHDVNPGVRQGMSNYDVHTRPTPLELSKGSDPYQRVNASTSCATTQAEYVDYAQDKGSEVKRTQSESKCETSAATISQTCSPSLTPYLLDDDDTNSIQRQDSGYSSVELKSSGTDGTRSESSSNVSPLENKTPHDELQQVSPRAITPDELLLPKTPSFEDDDMEESEVLPYEEEVRWFMNFRQDVSCATKKEQEMIERHVNLLRDGNCGNNFKAFVDHVIKRTKADVLQKGIPGPNTESGLALTDEIYFGRLGVKLLQLCVKEERSQQGYCVLHSLHAIGLNYSFTSDTLSQIEVLALACDVCLDLNPPQPLSALEVLRGSNYGLPIKGPPVVNEVTVTTRMQTFSSVIKTLIRHKNYEEAYELFEKYNWVDRKPLDDMLVISNELLTNLSQQRHVDKASSVYSIMETNKISHDKKSFRAYLDCCAFAGKNKRARFLFLAGCIQGCYPNTFRPADPLCCILNEDFTKTEVKFLLEKHLSSIAGLANMDEILLQNTFSDKKQGIGLTIVLDFAQNAEDFEKVKLTLIETLTVELNPPLVISNSDYTRKDVSVEASSVQRWLAANPPSSRHRLNVCVGQTTDSVPSHRRNVKWKSTEIPYVCPGMSMDDEPVNVVNAEDVSDMRDADIGRISRSSSLSDSLEGPYKSSETQKEKHILRAIRKRLTYYMYRGRVKQADFRDVARNLHEMFMKQQPGSPEYNECVKKAATKFVDDYLANQNS